MMILLDHYTYGVKPTGFVVLVILNVVVWFEDPFLPAPGKSGEDETLQKK